MSALDGLVGFNRWIETDEGVIAFRTDRVITIPVGENTICNAQSDLGLLKIDDPHPCFPGLVVREINGRENADSNDQYDVEYVFRAPNTEAQPGGQFSMAASLTAEKVTRDRDGNQISVTYTYPTAYKDVLLAGQTRNQIPEVEFQAPTQVLRWTRLQDSFNTAYSNVNAVHGTLNEFAIYSKDPETLLCTRAEVEQANLKFRETYEFQWRRQGWKVYGIFLQEDDNKPVENPQPASEVLADVLPLYDYSLLGLLLPS